MSILDVGSGDGPAAGFLLILVSATAVISAWLAIALLSLLG